MLTCATCGNDEPAGSQFCGNCGAPFAPADQDLVHAAMSGEALLTCGTCGNEEPEGSRFCGTCGSAFAPTALGVALASEAPSAPPAVEQPARVAPPRPQPRGTRRLRWVAAGAAVGLLIAGGAVAGVLTLTGGDDDMTQATPTDEEPLPATTVESPPPASSSTLLDSMHPRFVALVGYQGALSARVRSLEAGVESFAALRQAAAALGASVEGTQVFLNGYTPADSKEAETLSLLQSALAAHLAYTDAISRFPRRPRSFTSAEAREAIARAGQAHIAYAGLATAEPAMSGISLDSSDHARLLRLVPSPTPPRSTVTRRVIDLVPLLVGIRPDDALGEGRCFGPYAGASLRVSGVVYRSGFIQCGDDADGDPSRASGEYRFSGLSFVAGSRLVRFTAQAVIDEFSSPSQRGTSVTWAAFYDGAPICSGAMSWSGPRPSPRKLDCRLPSAVASRGFDARRLRVRQDVSLASSGTFWAGLFHPTIVVEVPR